MPVAEDSIRVTIRLPKRLYERATDSAARARISFDEQIAGFVENGLTQVSVDQSLDEAYAAYLNHMQREGRGQHTATELWDQMRRIRKEVADELDTR